MSPPRPGQWVLSNWEPIIVLWDYGWYAPVVLPFHQPQKPEPEADEA